MAFSPTGKFVKLRVLGGLVLAVSASAKGEVIWARNLDGIHRAIGARPRQWQIRAMALEPRAGGSQLTQVSLNPWTARVVKAAGWVQLALGFALVGWAAIDPPLPAPPLIGFGGSAIVNGTGYLLGVPPWNLRLTLASVTCIALGMLSLLL